MTYPNDPGFKESGTSRDAAKAVSSVAATMRFAALREIVRASTNTPPGLTADEIADKLGQSVLAIRPRVSELHSAGTIVKTGERRTNRSGLSACVWTVKP